MIHGHVSFLVSWTRTVLTELYSNIHDYRVVMHLRVSTPLDKKLISEEWSWFRVLINFEQLDLNNHGAKPTEKYVKINEVKISTRPSSDLESLPMKPRLRKDANMRAFSPIYKFVLVAVETHGGLGEEACHFMQELGRRITSVTGERRATEFLIQRLSVAIQRGNASCVLGTVNLSTDYNNLGIVHCTCRC